MWHRTEPRDHPDPAADSIYLEESHGVGLWKRHIVFKLGSPIPTQTTSIKQACLSLVLPHGYPHSVSQDYIAFQLWDTVQGLSTYLRSIICQQSLLTGLGVGDSSANVASAALSWALLSGMSMLGGIIFAFQTSSDFGANPKRWRLFADCMNDIGLTLTLVAPLTGYFFMPFASCGAICSAICGVAAGATKAAITQHFTKQKANSALISDIHTKEGTQETIVSVTGLILGWVLSLVVGDSLRLRWAVFIMLTALHVVANYWAVTSLCLTTLNEERAFLLISYYFLHDQVLSPVQVSSRESLWRYRSPYIRVGVPFHEIVRDQHSYRLFKSKMSSQHDKTYLIWETKHAICILLHEWATCMEILRAYFEAYRALVLPVPETQDKSAAQFEKFTSGLKCQGWTLSDIMLPDENWRCKWK